jgi:osmotically-inducible protein OsmY
MSCEMWLTRDESVAEAALQQLVWDELHDEPLLAAANLGVEVTGSAVELIGTVESYPAKLAAEAAVRRVPGVGAVSDKIVVRLPYGAWRADPNLSDAVRHALEWDVRVPPGQIVAHVTDGHVTLRGVVRHAFARDAAEEAVRALVGVTGLTNAVALVGDASADGLEASVERVLRRRARPFHRRARADVRDGTVVLRGQVRTLADRVETERAVEALPGVRRVVDHLHVAER